MACGREMKDCVTGHMRERAELKAQGVARLNFRVLYNVGLAHACMCIAHMLNARVCLSSRAAHGKVNSALAGRSITKSCKL